MSKPLLLANKEAMRFPAQQSRLASYSSWQEHAVVHTHFEVCVFPGCLLLFLFLGCFVLVLPHSDLEGVSLPRCFARPVPGVSRRGIVGELAHIAHTGGVDALFAGWGPRAARAAPTGAIVLVAYEVVKTM